MPAYEVTSPDGKTWEVNAPEGATQDQVLAYAKQQWSAQQKPAAAPPAAVQAGQTIGGIPRQLGLAARYGAEGLASLADPLRMALNAVGVPGQSRPMADVVGGYLTKAGLPEPQSANERVIGDASRLVAGGAGGGALAGRLAQGAGAVAQNVLGSMAARPGMTALSGAGAGLAGGSVREADGSPMAQFGASLLGGIAAPLAAQGAMNAGRRITNAVKGMAASPLDLDARLSIELQRAGVDPSTIGASMRAQLREDSKKALISGQPMDPAALRRLADYRRIGATPLIGDITQDPALLSQQRNLSKQMANTANAGGANLPGIENANARRVMSTLEGSTSSPLDAYATGQGIIGRINGTNDALTAGKSALYKEARDSQGRAIPLARDGFVNKAFENLTRENKLAFLPPEVSSMLNQISLGKITQGGRDFDVPFDVNTIDQLETILASATRGAKDGNAKAALKAVRDALMEVDLQPANKAQFGGSQLVTAPAAEMMRAADSSAANAMGKFREARGAAREQFAWQESAKFIEDAVAGVAPDKFVQKHIINASVEDLSRLRSEIGGGVSSSRAVGPVVPGATAPAGPNLNEAVRKQLVDYILQRGKADSDTVKFSSAGMNDALKAIGDRKLSLFFAPEEIAQLKSAVNVGRYMQSQPIGSAVNNSNTAGAALGRMSGLLDRASPIPFLGPMVTDPIKGGLLQMQVRGMNNLSRGLLSPRDVEQMAITPSLMLPGLLAAPTIN